MGTLIVIGSLLALVLLGAYWEWRYRVYGWGRGLMHNSADRAPTKTDSSYISPNPWDITIPVKVRWEFDLPLPPNWKFDLPLPPKEDV